MGRPRKYVRRLMKKPFSRTSSTGRAAISRSRSRTPSVMISSASMMRIPVGAGDVLRPVRGAAVDHEDLVRPPLHRREAVREVQRLVERDDHHVDPGAAGVRGRC
jgi:hypothetical protein